MGISDLGKRRGIDFGFTDGVESSRRCVEEVDEIRNDVVVPFFRHGSFRFYL